MRPLRVAVLVAALIALSAPAASYASGVTVADLDNGATANGLAAGLAGAGITVSNVTYVGDSRAAGAFTSGAGSIGFANGMVLSSGKVQTYTGASADPACSQGVEGPNNCNEGPSGTDGGENTTDFGTPGDTQLDTLSGQTTGDAAVLEFDFVPQQATVHFHYVFSSEEYSDFSNTAFNDSFAFYVNGTNCALVPGTSDPVTVNSINNGNDEGGDATAHHPDLFRDNVNPSASIDSQMDGLTTVLTCSANVNAGVANHMKLAIADASDTAYDSAVFIESGSLASGEPLTVTKAGTGSGGVTSSPAGINCGATCSHTFDDNASVTLTASADAGSTFSGWSGEGCSGTGTCTVTMNQARNVTATFTLNPPPVQPPPSYTLTVTKAGSGTGGVTSSPAGINCGATCSALFTSPTSVILTATPTGGSTFSGWSGDCSGTGTCTVTMNAAHAVTATFTGPIISPPSVNGGDLFCGAQHRGKCKGITTKVLFTGPGNASWTYDLYNPSPGKGATAAASKKIRLGQIKKVIKKAGVVTVVFKMKPGKKTNKLYKQVKKLKLRSLLITVRFTDKAGHTTVQTKTIKLKL
jgi:hypothetical protein